MKRGATKRARFAIARQEQVARERRHRGDDRIVDDERAALRDLDAAS